MGFDLSCCFSTGTALRRDGYYYYSVALEQMDNVMCTGTESELRDCRHDLHVVNTNTAVGMNCGYC